MITYYYYCMYLEVCRGGTQQQITRANPILNVKRVRMQCTKSEQRNVQCRTETVPDTLTHANRAPTGCNFRNRWFVVPIANIVQFGYIRATIDIHSLPLDQLDLCAKEMILWYGNQNGCNSIFFFVRSFVRCRQYFAILCEARRDKARRGTIFLISSSVHFSFIHLLTLRQAKKKANCNLFLLPIATTKAINFSVRSIC